MFQRFLRWIDTKELDDSMRFCRQAFDHVFIANRCEPLRQKFLHSFKDSLLVLVELPGGLQIEECDTVFGKWKGSHETADQNVTWITLYNDEPRCGKDSQDPREERRVIWFLSTSHRSPNGCPRISSCKRR